MTTITEQYQPSLLDPPRVEVHKDRLTTEQQWDRFRRRNGWFMPRLAELAYEQRSRGQRVSTKAIFELLRPEVEKVGSEFGLNNSFTSLAADLLIEDYPDLESSIERRRRRS